MHILVVEDDKQIRAFLAELLTDEGYTVDVAEHGRAALEVLARLSTLPSLILLDLMMPIMDGWQFCEALGQDPVLQHIPIIILSAVTNVRERACGLNLEAVMPKPFNVDQLLALVAKSA